MLRAKANVHHIISALNYMIGIFNINHCIAYNEKRLFSYADINLPGNCCQNKHQIRFLAIDTSLIMPHISPFINNYCWMHNDMSFSKTTCHKETRK